MTTLLLPGLICDRTIWSRQIAGVPALANAIVPDFGLANSLPEMARRALELAPPRFALAGHSMGARVALELFRLAPERIERLALLDTGVHGVQPGEADKRMALLAVGEEQGMAALVDSWLPPMVHPARHGDDSIMRPLRDMCIRASLPVFRAQVEALLARPEVESLLPKIACPTLVATGRQDAWSPVEQHVSIAGAVPRSTLVVFEDAGHMAPFESPGQVNAALEGWLSA